MMPAPTTPSAMSYVDPAAVAAAETVKARINAAYQMALYKPRNYDQSRVRILEACKRPGFAEKVQYSKPTGKDKHGKETFTIGPSIRFAELALREWGNILYENQVVFDDEMIRRVQVTIIDLETNATFGASVQIIKTVERRSNKGRDVVGERVNSYGDKVYIVKATDDELQIKQAAMISKTLRNEGLRLIPQEIIEEAIEVSQETMSKRDAADPDAARKKVVDAFFSLGVQPKDLESYLGHPVAQCAPPELQGLRSMYAAIRDGEAKWSDFAKKGDTENGETDAAQKTREILEKRKGATEPQNTSPAISADTAARNTPGAMKSDDFSDTAHLQAILLDVLGGDSGLGLTAAEQATFVKKHTKIGDLTADEIDKLIIVAREMIEARDNGAALF